MTEEHGDDPDFVKVLKGGPVGVVGWVGWLVGIWHGVLQSRWCGHTVLTSPHHTYQGMLGRVVVPVGRTWRRGDGGRPRVARGCGKCGGFDCCNGG